MQPYELERMARDIQRELEPKIAASTRQMEAQLEKLSQFWDSYPALIRQTLDAGNASPATPAPASPAPPAPEPTLAEKLEAMEPQAFFAAMQADPQAMLAKIAQADQE